MTRARFLEVAHYKKQGRETLGANRVEITIFLLISKNFN